MNSRQVKYLGTGWNRIVFLLPSGRYVIKIPLNDCGVIDNVFEARSCKKNDFLFQNQKARCRLWGICLVMEYVEPYYDYEGGMPDWTYSVDCNQVGITRTGHLVAYDFA